MTSVKILKAAGWIIAAIGIFFVIDRIVENGRELVRGLDAYAITTIITALSFLYALILLLMTAAWTVLMNGLDERRVGFAQAFGVYGRSQIAKYLPGNVGHLAGRQVLGGLAGWRQAPIALASILETGVLLVCSASIVILFGALTEPVLAPRLGGRTLVILSLAVVGGLWALPLLLHRMRWLDRYLDIAKASAFTRSWRLPLCAALYVIFLCLGGTLLWLLGGGLGGALLPTQLPTFIFVSVASWLAGYLTPGAPGGVGIREAAIVLLLAPSVGEAPALALALGFRLVTTFGDLLLFGGAWFVHSRSARPAA